jgi:serine/threonine-protein kinase
MSKMLGKYEIIKTLGQGAMGEVYLAHHPAIGREVAIKTILPKVAKGDEAEGRFRREAEAAGQLSHPNLVTVFDFDKDGDVFYLVMEYVKGDDLEDLIRQDALSHSEFLEVLAQVCDGLSHAHRNGIIHRDIKPSNIRVIRDGKHLLAKVMDFGIARMEDSNMTATGIVMGTVSYMAPEYIREGHATSQSDLFAVGVMLYECLTGRKPFAGDNTTTILFKIVSDPPPPVDPSLIHGISPSIREVLDKALAKDPSARFQTADDLGKALRACKDPTWSGSLEGTLAMLAQHQAGLAEDADGTRVLKAGPPALVTPRQDGVQPDTPKASPSRAGLYVAAAVAVLAVAGGGAYVATRPKVEAPATVVPMAGQATQIPVAGQATQTPVAGQATQTPVAQAPRQTPESPSPGPGQAPAPLAVPVTSANAPKGVEAKLAPAKPEPARTATAKPEAPKAEPPRPEPAKVDPAKQAMALLGTDPKQAAALLKPLVQASPGSVELNANYLAALYRANNPWDFDRGLTHAAAAGVTTKTMFSVPAFRSAMIDERNLVKAHNGQGVLPAEVMEKVIAGL